VCEEIGFRQASCNKNFSDANKGDDLVEEKSSGCVYMCLAADWIDAGRRP
jgi:hypothetical protein